MLHRFCGCWVPAGRVFIVTLECTRPPQPYATKMDKTVEELISLFELQHQEPARNHWSDLQTHLPNAAGSSSAHQAWPGGYRDHVQEVMNLATILHARLSHERPLPFSLASALFVLFLHDCEKPFKQATDEQLKLFPWITNRPGKSDKHFQELLLSHYAFKPSADELNGLRYVEGENQDYIPGKRMQGPLAAFCHSCDVISARIWFDYPKKK